MRKTAIAAITVIIPVLLGNGGGELDAIQSTHGEYSITDISQYSDGKTYTISLSHNKSTTQLLFERPHSWKTTTPSGAKFVHESLARKILISWLERNFTCKQLSNIESAPKSQNSYFAGALIDILNYDKTKCTDQITQ